MFNKAGLSLSPFYKNDWVTTEADESRIITVYIFESWMKNEKSHISEGIKWSKRVCQCCIEWEIYISQDKWLDKYYLAFFPMHVC